jgi:hypothetical protein
MAAKREKASSRRTLNKGGGEKSRGREPGADPAEFDKKTSPVRERMAREIKEMSPEERLRKGP